MFAQWQVLLGCFLFQEKPSPLADAPLFSDPDSGDSDVSAFEWGRTPLEKVIWDADTLTSLALRPFVSRNSVSIIEPCMHVGFNAKHHGVRASKNVAYHLQLVADCDCVLYPLWHSGLRSSSLSPTTAAAADSRALPTEQLLPIVSASRAIIFEGGSACAYEPESFTERLRYEDLMGFVQSIMLSRLQMRAPSIFVCLGHQLAAQALTRLVIQVVDDARAAFALADDAGDVPQWLVDLHEEVEKIDSVGRNIVVRSRGVPPIRGYRSA
jgi:hypothetical protein